MANEFIKSDIATGTPEPVNLSNVFTFRKIDTGGQPKIQFSTVAANSNWQPIEWKYDTAANRDADYLLIETKYVTSINEQV